MLAESVATEVSQRGFFSPITSRDIQAMLGMERQRQLLGCSEEKGSCVTELAGALGARFILTGSLGKLGEAYQLNLQMLDSEKAQPVGRSTRIAKDLSSLRAQLPYAVAEATGTPLPPPPSRVLPYSLVGAGALAVVIGGVLEVNGVTQEGEVGQELAPSNDQPLQTKKSYDQRLQTAHRNELYGGIALGVGAALIAAGIALNPPEVVSGTSVKVVLVPSLSGGALVGVFP